ncbi:hypothetical protein DYD21_15225 [Rhodohalobacter sp. SW132]|uniref:outer membrane beta-barrel protein n=1 Tax=Rhodohalobacter sp. SW132 TaxID=2293433 RepID=UPI000E25F87B|nr:outer membrane beta-barrel protein [Rhodohalobacter sp. SW132]REL29199.1 hypothetical protein DYD21_15225 [Rhodohalobacter sp. SW132]
MNLRAVLLPLLMLSQALVLSLVSIGVSYSQQTEVTGSVLTPGDDSYEQLSGATVQVFSLPDTVRITGAATDRAGEFSVRIPAQHESVYFQISYLGFLSHAESYLLDELSEPLEIVLQPAAMELDEFQVTARRPRVEIRGDTTSFHADGYRANRDANVQDLVTRMPGFMMENGRLQAQGEDVGRVLIDGEEFFGDDAMLALQNLPAEIVAEIEVFDRDGEQARFTGFSSGDTERTINIVTRDGLNRGQFGRIHSGYGSLDRYMAGGNYNYFRGDQRISVLGMSNNVNQQNFSSEDLLGISEASGSGRRGRGGRATRNFMTGGQSGISSVNSTGINYNDQWNDNWRVNASYFFNLTDNTQNINRERQYLTGFSADQLYDEDAFGNSDNSNHRFDMRLEHSIDDRRSLIISPQISLQQNTSSRTVDGFTLDSDRRLINEILTENSDEQSAFSLNNTILYRHSFETDGRTFSANFRTNVNDRSSFRNQFDESLQFDEPDNRVTNDQQSETFHGGYDLRGNLTYTEPLTENSRLLVSYRSTYDDSRSEQDLFRYDEMTNSYSLIDSTLSSSFDNRVITSRMRGSYQLNRENYRVNVSLSWQHTALDGEQHFPVDAVTRQTWQNLMPDAEYRYNFGRRSNIRIRYNTGTRTPSARQLQGVIDNSDPLRFTTGNPDLEQQFDHRFSVRMRHTNPEKGSSTSLFVSMNYTENYIGNRTEVAATDTLLSGDVLLRQGGRLVAPDNIGSGLNLYSRVDRSFPVDLIQSNANLSAGVNFSRNPSFIDSRRNETDNTRLSSGASVSSNISERVDFRMAYYANYSIVNNSIRPEMNNNYYTGRGSTGFNLMPWGGLNISSDLNFRHYEGLGDDFNQSTFFWNGSIGYKFLEDRAAEFKLTIFDILGQNNNINRNILEDYIEDYRTNVLTRYAIFSFSYNFRSFS